MYTTLPLRPTLNLIYNTNKWSRGWANTGSLLFILTANSANSPTDYDDINVLAVNSCVESSELGADWKPLYQSWGSWFVSQIGRISHASPFWSWIESAALWSSSMTTPLYRNPVGLFLLQIERARAFLVNRSIWVGWVIWITNRTTKTLKICVSSRASEL